MQIITISKQTLSGGQELAERLAGKLGYRSLSRDELIAAATEEGIKVGKLEMAMIKTSLFNEQLALERDHYLAFSTAYLCQKAIESEGLVYHGRAGHLLLRDMRHILRVSVIADEEYIINEVRRNLNLDRKKAQQYIAGVDEGRRRWVHNMYGVSWDDASYQDMVINLSQMNIENAASALVSFAQLPDFKITPASRKKLEDILLAAQVRMAIARDDKTHAAHVKVRSDNGKVTVTYLPQDVRIAEAIQDAVQKRLPDLKEIRTTMAMTNILWVQEEFRPHTDLYNQIVDIATKWNAAIELIRLVPEGENENGQMIEASSGKELLRNAGTEYNGGIEEDTPEPENDEGGLKETLDELSQEGKSGGGRVVYGKEQQLVKALDRTVSYTLIVIGDLFLSKGHAAKIRAIRDLRGYLNDEIKVPVVTADELESQYLFGKQDAVRMISYLAVTVMIFVLVFTHQKPILEFLTHSGWYAEAAKATFLSKFGWLSKMVVAAVVFIFVPIVAYSYGKVASSFLKLMKME